LVIVTERRSDNRQQRASASKRPLIGVLCCNQTLDGRPAQAVASRFVEPLATIAGVSVLLVPSIPQAVDTGAFAGLLDGLLLTGACSNLAARRYHGRRGDDDGSLDEDRDEVALRLAGRMIDAGRPVFGICRGLQELNVLFGGTLRDDVGPRGHHRGQATSCHADFFDHHHDIDVADDGVLAARMGRGRHRVNSVHNQGIALLGPGLAVEAVSPEDGLIEAVSARPAGGRVLGVQWHPEWDVRANPASRHFFELLGEDARG
jgi:putative glutamine amidotransferase